jgi:hypothetical protein
MAFWTDSKLEPLRKFRFRIQTTSDSNLELFNGFWFWAKTIDLPSYEINSGEYQLGNNKVKYPGILEWRDVNLTFVDTGRITSKLYANLISMGYQSFGKANKSIGGLKKSNYSHDIVVPGSPDRTQLVAGAAGLGITVNSNNITKVVIQQLDDFGKTIYTWELMSSFVKSVNFGNLEYSSDDLQEISMTISYDYANFIEITPPQVPLPPVESYSQDIQDLVDNSGEEEEIYLEQIHEESQELNPLTDPTIIRT